MYKINGATFDETKDNVMVGLEVGTYVVCKAPIYIIMWKIVFYLIYYLWESDNIFIVSGKVTMPLNKRKYIIEDDGKFYKIKMKNILKTKKW